MKTEKKQSVVNEPSKFFAQKARGVDLPSPTLKILKSSNFTIIEKGDNTP